MSCYKMEKEPEDIFNLIHSALCVGAFKYPQPRVFHIQSTPIFISWSFPPSGFIKINTDGSFVEKSGLAGFGGLARDDRGRWIGGFCGRIGAKKVTSSLTPELWAIHGGLIFAKHYKLKKVIIETDSNNALKLLSTRNDVASHPDHVVIEECRRLMFELKISIMHTLREGNNCADSLAKLGRLQNQDFVIVRRPPPPVYELLLADIAHVAFPLETSLDLGSNSQHCPETTQI